jgi:hypothetical protein
MATGSLDANGIWQYGEDDSEATASALLNKLGASVSTQIQSLVVKNVVQVTKTNVFSSTSASYVDITGLSLAISPSAASSKILVMVNLHLGHSTAGGGNANAQVLRGATALGNASNGSSMGMVLTDGTGANRLIGHSAFMFIDSPGTTSSTTYKVQLKTPGGTAYLNRTGASTNENYVSSITLMEIKG